MQTTIKEEGQVIVDSSSDDGWQSDAKVQSDEDSQSDVHSDSCDEEQGSGDEEVDSLAEIEEDEDHDEENHDNNEFGTDLLEELLRSTNINNCVDAELVMAFLAEPANKQLYEDIQETMKFRVDGVMTDIILNMRIRAFIQTFITDKADSKIVEVQWTSLENTDHLPEEIQDVVKRVQLEHDRVVGIAKPSSRHAELKDCTIYCNKPKSKEEIKRKDDEQKRNNMNDFIGADVKMEIVEVRTGSKDNIIRTLSGYLIRRLKWGGFKKHIDLMSMMKSKSSGWKNYHTSAKNYACFEVELPKNEKTPTDSGNTSSIAIQEFYAMTKNVNDVDLFHLSSWLPSKRKDSHVMFAIVAREHTTVCVDKVQGIFMQMTNNEDGDCDATIRTQMKEDKDDVEYECSEQSDHSDDDMFDSDAIDSDQMDSGDEKTTEGAAKSWGSLKDNREEGPMRTRAMRKRALVTSTRNSVSEEPNGDPESDLDDVVASRKRKNARIAKKNTRLVAFDDEDDRAHGGPDSFPGSYIENAGHTSESESDSSDEDEDDESLVAGSPAPKEGTV